MSFFLSFGCCCCGGTSKRVNAKQEVKNSEENLYVKLPNHVKPTNRQATHSCRLIVTSFHDCDSNIL